jgi:hypothetical protein
MRITTKSLCSTQTPEKCVLYAQLGQFGRDHWRRRVARLECTHRAHQRRRHAQLVSLVGTHLRFPRAARSDSHSCVALALGVGGARRHRVRNVECCEACRHYASTGSRRIVVNCWQQCSKQGRCCSSAHARVRVWTNTNCALTLNRKTSRGQA